MNIGNELLESFDNEGRAAGLQPRWRVHTSGLWHRSVNVIVFRMDGRMLIQLRAATRDVCPGIWDLSVAEHLKPGETSGGAAARGLEEELSLRGVKLYPIGPEVRHKLELDAQGIRDFEWQRLFVCCSQTEPILADAEVAEVRYVTLAEVRQLRAESPDTLTPWFRAWLDVMTDEELMLAFRHSCVRSGESTGNQPEPVGPR